MAILQQESASHRWDADQYVRFLDQRTLPGIDLLSRVHIEAPTRIVDLGCGPGNSTAPLLERWPEAAVVGVDASVEMLDAARLAHPGITFVAADIASWQPETAVDLLFSNAALQWVGGHERLIPRLFETIRAGGAFAVQMPRNHDFATHALMREVASEDRWRDRLTGARDPSPVRSPDFYYDLLAPISRSITIWETNYIQIMTNVAAIVDWLRGTGLRPFLSRLAPDEQAAFLERYCLKLEAAFPARADGKLLLPYPRLFFVAYPA